MKRCFFIYLMLAAVFVNSCNTSESDVDQNDKTDTLQEIDNGSNDLNDWVGDEFNELSEDLAFFAADGGMLMVSAVYDILFHMVRLSVDGEPSERVVFEGQSLDVDSRPPFYPTVFELECCTVTLSDARTILVIVPPSDIKRVIRITVSGIKDDGTFLSPRDIVLYQNY